MYVEVQDKNNNSTYINTEQICSIQFNREESRVFVSLSNGETVTVDYNSLFAYPARKINYGTFTRLKSLAGLTHVGDSVHFTVEGITI